MRDFSEYRDYYAPKMENHPLGEDFLTLLEWVSDKPGEVIGYTDIAKAVTGREDLDTLDHETFSRILPLSVMLSTWSMPLANVFFVVKDAQGCYHDVDTVDQETTEGKRPYVIPATGETVEDFPSNAYPRFRLADFTLPTPMAAPGPRP